jgi:hypothetical protein
MAQRSMLLTIGRKFQMQNNDTLMRGFDTSLLMLVVKSSTVKLVRVILLTLSVVTFEAEIDVDDLGVEYNNEDYLVEAIKEHINYAMDRLDADVTFNKVDVESCE